MCLLKTGSALGFGINGIKYVLKVFFFGGGGGGWGGGYNVIA